MIFRSLRKHFSKNLFVQRTTKLITGTIIAHLIMIGISPILTRLYAPRDFGILSFYVSIASILAIIITLRYELAIMLPKKDSDGWSLVLLSLFVNFVLSLTLFLIIFIFKIQLIDLIQYAVNLNEKFTYIITDKDISSYLYLIPLSTFFMGALHIFLFWTSRRKKFKFQAISKVIKQSSIGATQLGSGFFLTPHPLGLIAGQIVGNFTAAFSLILKSLKDKEIIRYFSLKRIIKNAKKYKKFPLFTSWANLFNAISENVPIIFLFLFYSHTSAGFYAIATRVIKLPSALVSNSVKHVYYQKASEKHSLNQSMKGLFSKVTKKLLLIGIIPLALVAIFAKDIFGFIFGEQWQISGIYASILAPWMLAAFINTPSQISIFILQMNQFHLKYELFLLLFRIVALVVGLTLFNKAIISLLFLSAIGVIFNLFLVFFVSNKLKNDII